MPSTLLLYFTFVYSSTPLLFATVVLSATARCWICCSKLAWGWSSGRLLTYSARALAESITTGVEARPPPRPVPCAPANSAGTTSRASAITAVDRRVAALVMGTPAVGIDALVGPRTCATARSNESGCGPLVHRD